MEDKEFIQVVGDMDGAFHIITGIPRGFKVT